MLNVTDKWLHTGNETDVLYTSIHFKWFFLNVFISKLYRRNTDLQIDTSNMYIV